MANQMNIMLPDEMALLVRHKVVTGEYADESEVIRDGLEALKARDQTIEEWLLREVAPAYDALQRHPERAVPASHLRESLAAEHAKRT